MADVLAVYYSRRGQNYFRGSIRDVPVGNTEIAVGFVRELTGADVFEVDTVKPYGADYRQCVEEAKAEVRSDARPAIKEKLGDISGYEYIVVAYPCWCGTMPMCMFTALEGHDFSGKKILPICTNEGSGMGHSERDLKRLCQGADVRPGLPIDGSSVRSSKAEIGDWLRANGVL